MQRNKCVFVFLLAATLALGVLGVRAQAQTESIIYTFSGGTDGSIPEGGLIFDASGNLYGLTESGGANGAGTVFELSPASGGGWTQKVLYAFSFTGGDVYLPTSNLVFDAKGNLFGIAPLGGASGAGGVFELTPGANGTWTEKIIYSFSGGTDVVTFQTSLVMDSAGNFYFYRNGSVSSNGTNSYGGVVELQAGSQGTWSEKILHNFSGGNDGSAPYGGRLTLDSAGNLYGEAYAGGHDFGLVFELVKGSNGTWTEKILHTFVGSADGSAAFAAPLTIDGSGRLFGASEWNVFQLVPGSNGSWTEKILHTFQGGSDGAYPESGLTIDASGKLYGTTNLGGLHHGTVFQLTPGSNGTWSEKILHKFTVGTGDGYSPFFMMLAIDSKGNLYGTTPNGGANNSGVVFQVTP